MPDIRCPNCGENNPDFLDVCQFCQTPLKSESMLHTGDSPTKRSTGELEPILPDWLKEARQQNRDAAEEEAREAATQPKIPTVEPPDLLAGLASQAESEEEAVPDWLAGLNPVKDKPAPASQPAEESPNDFFSQFRQGESQQPEAPTGEPKEEIPAWMAGSEEQTPEQRDELSDWFSRVSSESNEPSPSEGASQDDLGWLSSFGESKPSAQEPPAEAGPEDLSWLHNLEAASNQADEPSSPGKESSFEPDESLTGSSSQADLSWLNDLGGIEGATAEDSAPAQPVSSSDDLSWLNNLGGIEGTSSFEETPAQPESSQEDLSWLNNLGGIEGAPSFEETPAQPESSQEDLSWLKNLGGIEGTPSFEEIPTQPKSSQEDLSWLNDLGGTEPQPAIAETPTQQPESAQDGLDWLNKLGETEQAPSEESPVQPESAPNDLSWLDSLGRAEEQPFFEEPASTVSMDQLDDTDWLEKLEARSEPPAPEAPVSRFSPPRTAPLSQEAANSIPDWLKSATEEPSMPPPGGATLDWFAEHDKSAGSGSTPEPLDQTPPEPAPVEPAFEVPASGPESVSSEDVESMFSMDMPDWLTREPESAETTAPSSETTSEDETLSPVELPSWVQAMRPVESVIAESAASTADQVMEKEGPLAGFRGVIPFGPIGSSRRPRALTLKLQVTDEQQASAALLEQIINNETTALPKKTSSSVAPQRAVRWILAGLFVLVLGIVIFLGTRSMPIVAPASVNDLVQLVSGIPDNSQVLVVVDYEPSLAGELEPASGPLLDQLASTRHSIFTFLSMSPNGAALVERLLTDTNITGELGYQAGTQYFNIGYLPGGSAGVLGFVEDPKMVMPAAPVNALSDYAAILVLTDHPESGRVWVEQLEQAKQKDPALASRPLLMVTSAQAGPMLQPYVSSGQVAGMINGLADAAKYEFMNNSGPGIARTYWDAFGVGLMMAVIAIVLGSLWSLFTGMRARRAESEQG